MGVQVVKGKGHKCASGSVRVLRYVDRTVRSQPPDTLCLVREHVCFSTQETHVPVMGGGVVGNRQPSEAVCDRHGMILPQLAQVSFRTLPQARVPSSLSPTQVVCET